MQASSSRPPHAEPRSATGLHGMSARSVGGARLRVYYEEDGRLVGYPGSAESVDASKGLKVRLDGFSKREWVTDDDEWEWIDGAVGADGTRPLEHYLGSVLRQYIVRLAQAKERFANLAEAALPPAPAGKRQAAGAAGGGDKKRAKPTASQGAGKAGRGKNIAAEAPAGKRRKQ